MPIQQMPTFKSVDTKRQEIPQPGIGGLNLFDLEYEQEVNQSPYMLNMMYRNGTFSKRYGQEKYFTSDLANEIYAIEYFNGDMIIHSGTKLYKVDTDTKVMTELTNGGTTITLSEQKGMFIKFAYCLYYWCDGTIYEYSLDENVWKLKEMVPYIPDVAINCQITHTEGVADFEKYDDYNLLSRQFNEIFTGDGTHTDYPIYDKELYDQKTSIIKYDVTPTVTIDDVVTTAFTFDTVNKKVIFTTAPAQDAEVKITYTLKDSFMAEDRTRLLNSKYSIAYGSSGYSRLFLAGGGDSKYFYSDSYDATYFPELNFEILGSTEDDIKGFGLQYNTLFVLKPREVFSVSSYLITASMVSSDNDDLIGSEAFTSQIVNASVGCDCPNTIQIINNQLTWMNTIYGVCTLVSTSIIDERNIRVISRNINHTNNFNVEGILDIAENKEEITSIDYDNKYFLFFPTNGKVFIWDYKLSPYSVTTSRETDPRTLSWFDFDNIYAGQVRQIQEDLVYLPIKTGFKKNLIIFNDDFSDVDFSDATSTELIGINAYYMTPFLQFGAVEYLKTVKNIYVQVRGDTASVIDFYYYTNDSVDPEKDAEPVRIGGRVWTKFDWDTFQWFSVNWANVFRRKCNLKKIQMCAFYFENKDGAESVAGRDMSISGICLQYQIIKTIR